MKKQGKKYGVIVAVLLVLFSSIGGTAAYLSGVFGLTNTFVQGVVEPVVAEDFNGSVKRNVYVENKGNVPAYIRCRVSIYQELADKSISMNKPQEGTDYEIQFPAALDANWLQINGIYYYKKPVEAGARTENLFNECKLKKDGLVVDISVQAIQVDPPAAVREAWSVVEVGSDGCLKQAASAGV